MKILKWCFIVIISLAICLAGAYVGQCLLHEPYQIWLAGVTTGVINMAFLNVIQ